MLCPGEADGEAALMGTDNTDAELEAWMEAELLGVSPGKKSALGEEKANSRPYPFART